MDGQPGGLARQLHHVLPAHRGAGHVPAVALLRHLPAAPRQHQVGVRVRHRQGAAVRGGGVLGRVPVRLRVRRGEGGSAAAAQAARFGPAADDKQGWGRFRFMNFLWVFFFLNFLYK